ncbi:ML domain-containing protein [Helicostylum pulchrum]|nr:ML domain-containing protein [Helicostylum pulchrum]
MKFFILTVIYFFILYTVSFVHAQVDVPRTSLRLCDKYIGSFKFNYIRLNPNPPVKGQKVLVEYGGYLNEKVPQGSFINLLVNYGSIPIIQERFDLCNDTLIAIGKCPFETGNYNLSTRINVPDYLPIGGYVVQADILTPHGKRISCLTLNTFLF